MSCFALARRPELPKNPYDYEQAPARKTGSFKEGGSKCRSDGGHPELRATSPTWLLCASMAMPVIAELPA
jgi:hypothetical protein